MYKRMLVPVDGSLRSEVVVSHAAETAKAFGCSIRLLTVVDLDKRNGKVAQDNHSDEAASLAWVESQIEEAENHLRPVAERFEEHGLKPEMEVRFGNPPAEILKAAAEYGTDIIAMATRSRRGVARLMFGSVADQVLRESHVPVLLITAA
ncbi:MAG: universal stress protein [Dehalococcoidia bacterium]|jgi:nucleotide-binding universal stress UspA family protein|nr:universal stress protein [Dehalococcoidia bacterium]